MTPLTATIRARREEIELQEFAGWMRSWGASDQTINARVKVIRSGLRRWNPLTVTPEELGAWLGDPSHSQWTRVTYYSHLRSYFEYLTLTRRRADDPVVQLKRPKDPRRKPRPLNTVEVSRVLSAADARETAWIYLSLLAGLRAFEIAKFRGEDITEDTLFVRGKGGVDSFLPTHETLWMVAQHYPRTGFWFPSARREVGHIHQDTVTARITRLFRQVGIRDGSLHRLRHTYGTTLLRNGTNIRVVQELMRHATLNTTAGYLLVENDEMRSAVQQLSPGLTLSRSA